MDFGAEGVRRSNRQSLGGALLRAPRRRDSLADDAPEHFVCPISMRIMTEPVIAVTGHTYEAASITEWVKARGTCPNTRERLTLEQLLPNRALKNAIVDWRQQRRRALTEDPVPLRSSGGGYVAWESQLAQSLTALDLEDPVVKYIEHLYEGDRDEKDAALIGLLATSGEGEEGRYRVAQAGGVPALLPSLTSGKPEDIAKVAASFYNLCRSDNPFIAHSCSAAIPGLVHVLKADVKEAVPSACGALMRLSAATDANKLAIAGSGSIPALLEHLKPEAGMTLETLQDICEILRNIATSDKRKAEVARSGGIPWLTLMAGEHPCAMLVLASLPCNHVIASEMVSEDALPMLVSYVNRPTTDFQDEVAAGTALMRIASFPDLREKLLDCDPNILHHMHQTGLWGFIEQTGSFQVPPELSALVAEGVGGAGVDEGEEDDALEGDGQEDGDGWSDGYDSGDDGAGPYPEDVGEAQADNGGARAAGAAANHYRDD